MGRQVLSDHESLPAWQMGTDKRFQYDFIKRTQGMPGPGQPTSPALPLPIALLYPTALSDRLVLCSVTLILSMPLLTLLAPFCFSNSLSDQTRRMVLTSCNLSAVALQPFHYAVCIM